MKNLTKTIGLTLIALFGTSILALPVNAQPTWNTQVVDHRGSGGSLAIDSKGNPHVLFSDWYIDNEYWETRAFNLNYVVWAGTSWSNQSLDPAIVGGSLALDSNDNPHIIFSTSNILKHAFYDGKSWTIQTIDFSPIGNTGYSWVLDSKGNPHIVYTTYNEGTNTFKYSYLDGANWKTQIIDSSNATLGYYQSPSLVIDSSNNPRIIYCEATKYYFTENASWPTSDVIYVSRSGSGWSIQNVVSNVGSTGNLAIDFWGNPSFTYYRFENLSYTNHGSYNTYHVDSSLNYAHWGGFSWITQGVDFPSQSSSNNGRTFLHIDPNGNPQIFSYSINYRNENLSGLICVQWTGANWSVQNLGSIPAEAHFYEGMERIDDIALDAHGNLCFLYEGETGTLRSAAIWAGLTYATLEMPGYTSVVSSPLTILFTIVAVLGVIVVGLLLYRNHKRT
jgi:hypothetical protein